MSLDRASSSTGRRARLALIAALAAGACAHRPPGPGEALSAYGAALSAGDLRAAYALTSEGYRRRVSFDEFKARMEPEAATGSTLRDQGARWGDRVEVAIEGDDRVVLVREEGTWRLEEPPAPSWSQRTPRAALRTFVRAAQARRYDVLLRLAPARHRVALTVEKLRAFWEGPEADRLVKLVADLREALDARIVEEGDEALLVYGQGRQVRFLREDDLWRLDGPE
jgi:hypothetical protein